MLVSEAIYLTHLRAMIKPTLVDNLTYGVGFHNPGALDTSVSLYDDLTKSMSTGEGNYFELAASGSPIHMSR